MSQSRNERIVSQEEVNDFLDGLRESGVTSMYGAAPYIQEEFGLDQPTARRMLMVWMQTFSQRHPKVS